MSKRISSCSECTENCLQLHNNKFRHTVYDLSKFHERFNNFVHIDDQQWIDITAIQYKFEEIIKNICRIKTATMEKVTERRLMYALDIKETDRQEPLLNIAKAADNEQYSKLMCKEVAKLQQKITKQRNLRSREVKAITQKIQLQAQAQVLAIIQKFIPSTRKKVQPQQDTTGYRSRRRVVQPQQNQYKVPRQRRQKLQDNRPMRRPDHPVTERTSNKYSEQKPTINPKIKLNMRSNEYPTIKIIQIQGVNTHFNIILKVVQTRKVFTLQGKKKMQFIAGDETGSAIVVTNVLSFIRPGAVISISNARVYLFHGTTKQIQMSDHGSYVSQENVDIQVNLQYSLSNEETKETVQYPRARDQRQVERDVQPRRERRNRDQVPRESGVFQAEGQQDLPRPTRVQHRRRQGEQIFEKLDKTQVNRRQSAKQLPAQAVKTNDRKQTADQNTVVMVRKSTKVIDPDEGQEQDQKDVLNEKKLVKQVSSDKNSTKIANIQPGDQNLNIFAEIYGFPQKAATQKDKIVCMIGDQTGIVQAQLPRYIPYIKEGVVVYLKLVEASVVQHRITITLGSNSLLERTNMHILKINILNNMSLEQWNSEGEEEEEQQPQNQDTQLQTTKNISQIQDF